MRPLLVLAAAALIATAAASAAARDYATASVTPSGAGDATTLRVSLHTALQCGRLHRGRVILRLPPQMVVPAAPVVRLDHTVVPDVTVAGHTLTFAVPHSSGMTCMVIAPGTATVTVAGVRNPAAGRYAVSATVAGRTLTAALTVSS